MFLISFLTSKLQNYLAGFCSSSVLPTDCTEDLTIAVRDIHGSTSPQRHTIYIPNSVMPFTDKNIPKY